MLMKKGIIYGLICFLLSVGFIGMDHYGPDNLIRFHVIANSDSEEDQLLKYAVRDEVLKKVAPTLAESKSLQESRTIIQGRRDELLETAHGVVKEWGKDYPVELEYGIFTFPTKSYGNIVLPSGDYEAVEIKIGKAEGANWWCVLFPPLCFVNVQESTTLQVDGKAGVPIGAAAKKKELSYKGKEVGFYFERFLP